MDLRIMKRRAKVKKLIEQVLEIIEENEKEEKFMRKEISKKAGEGAIFINFVFDTVFLL